MHDEPDDGLNQFRGCLWLVCLGAVLCGVALVMCGAGWMTRAVREVGSL